uniref:Uncharacterized protein AlNc14C9G1156 n=1 Tax=Albugo laibachii Nc14 TaxID=890382 RepID=F0W2A6_9STRA|nr:conserved hypothetical protein [Albugo laibachii Nc14]|eukprot:CCA15191.1 conserved hypothetical protein [Albugo laibachii Nc14]
MLMDLGSVQGTFLNDMRIEPHQPMKLSNGDVIRFAASSRSYHVRNADPGDATSKIIDEIQSRSTPDMEEARQKRDNEIATLTAAMMQSPAAETYDAPPQDEHEKEDTQISGNLADDQTSDNESEDAQDDVNVRYKLPISNQVILGGHHTKSISCVGIDPPGVRVATGSMDYHVKLWDFAGMARHIRPFREIEVDDGHPIMALSYSPSGDRLLTVLGSSQPKVLTREGVEELQFVKGDMYVVDMAHTKGHTHATTGGQWHPKLRDEMITSSLDGTVRIWKLDGKRAFEKLINNKVLKLKGRSGKRCGVTTCTYNLDGSLIAGATADGQIHWIDPRRAYAGSSILIKDAHAPGSADLGISSIRIAPDNRFFASRSCVDQTIKIWDMRNTSSPLKICPNIDGAIGTANVAFNAAGSCLAAGTSVPRGKGLHGQVRFYDVHSPGLSEPIAGLEMNEDESAISVEWHHTINQLLVGTSENNCRVCYDPTLSTKGVLVSTMTKLKTKPAEFGARIDGVGRIHNPHALPMYRDEISVSRQLHRTRKDPVKSKAPEKPITGPGMGGKISGSTTFTQFFMKNHIKRSFREEDPREAILKYAKKAKDDPQFLGVAYAQSQPNDKIDKRYQLAGETLEEEVLRHEEEEKRLLQM